MYSNNNIIIRQNPENHKSGPNIDRENLTANINIIYVIGVVWESCHAINNHNKSNITIATDTTNPTNLYLVWVFISTEYAANIPIDIPYKIKTIKNFHTEPHFFMIAKGPPVYRTGIY